MNPVLGKILEWFKAHWLVVLLGLGSAGMFIYQKHQIDTLSQANSDEFARHTHDLDQMRQIYEHEHAAQEQINQQYNDTLQHLQTDYNQRLSDLETRTTARRQRFVTETAGNPSEMADRVRQRLGWSVPQ